MVSIINLFAMSLTSFLKTYLINKILGPYFCLEHKNNLTSAVRGKISNEMEQEVSYLKMSMEYLARRE